MNILAEIGVQSWRAKRPLPGAKPEISANVMHFFSKGNLVLSVVYPRFYDKKVVELLNGFWGAIENAGQCSRESDSVEALKKMNNTPVLILGEKAAQLIKENGVISTEILEKASILDEPEQVVSNPKLKTCWWKAVQACMAE